MNNKMTNDQITLSITLDHDDGVVRAQGWMKGQVNLSVKKATDTVDDDTAPLSSSAIISAGEIRVDLVGKELTFVPPHGVLCTLATACPAKREAVIFEEHRVVHDFEKQASFEGGEDGTVSYPFSIYLPHHLAPTMNFEENDGDGCCCVHYELTAGLAAPNLELTAEHGLRIVGATSSTKIYPYYLEPSGFKVNHTLGLLSPGCVALTAKVESTHVAKGEPLTFSVACRNKSRLDIHRVEACLVEEIHWKTTEFGGNIDSTTSSHVPSPRGEKTHEIVLVSFEDLILDSLVKKAAHHAASDGAAEDDPVWLDASDRPSSRDDIISTTTEVDGLTHAEMHGDLTSEQNLVRMLIPPQARNSYSGKFINISHYFQVTLVIKGKASDPHIKIPIKIFDPPMLESVLANHRAHSFPMSSQKANAIALTKWQDTGEIID